MPSLTLHSMALNRMNSQAVKWLARLSSFGTKTYPKPRKVAMRCSLSLCHATWRPHLVSHASFPLQATQRKCSSHVLTMYRRCLSLFQDRTPLMWCVMKIFTHLRCHLLHRTITKICAVLLQECLLEEMPLRPPLYSRTQEQTVSISSSIDSQATSGNQYVFKNCP